MASDATADRSLVWRVVKPYRGRMALLALLSLAGALLEAGFLVILTSAALGLASGNFDMPGPLAGASMSTVASVAAAAIAVRLALGLLSVLLASRLTESVTLEQRRRLAEAFFGASWETQSTEPSGQLQEVLVGFVYRATSAMTGVTQGLTAALSLVAFVGTGFFVDITSTTLVLGALTALGFVLVPLRRIIRRRSAIAATANLRFASSIAELGLLGQEMQVFGVRQAFIEHVEQLSVQTAAETRRVQALTGALTPIYTFLAYMAVVGSLVLLNAVGTESLGAVGAVLLLMLRSLSYGQQLLSVLGTLSSVTPFLQRLFETIERYENSIAPHGSAEPKSCTPIALTGVGFSYSSGRRALTSVTTTIGSGEMVGIVGPSGAGKSTLAQLLLGLQSPTRGTITIAGHDLTTLKRDWWTQRVAFVPQEPLLFTGSVADNIRFFRDGLSREDLEFACAQSNILDDIRALPSGLDTHLGERGKQLSGGQRQRLSLARALVGRPEILILDEATSALDGRSELLIRETLHSLRGRVTVLIIAHRLSTLEECDRILVIEDGALTAAGTSGEVASTNDFFRNALSISRHGK